MGQGIARKGHYGAFLLSETDLLVGIVRRLHQELPVPVTLKMRLVSDANDLQDTMHLTSSLEAAGVSVLTLHGRTKEMKGQMTGVCNWDAIAAIRRRVSVPLIANGGIETFEDATRCLEATGCDAVMSSEAVLETPSLFAPGLPAEMRPQVLPVSQDVLTAEYLELAQLYGTSLRCVKAHLFKFLYAGLQQHVDLRSQLGCAKCLDEMAVVARALRQRRDEARRMATVTPCAKIWPDTGWYLRYRRPLGGGEKAEKGGKKTRKRQAAAETEPTEAASLEVLEACDEHKRPRIDVSNEVAKG